MGSQISARQMRWNLVIHPAGGWGTQDKQLRGQHSACVSYTCNLQTGCPIKEGQNRMERQHMLPAFCLVSAAKDQRWRSQSWNAVCCTHVFR